MTIKKLGHCCLVIKTDGKTVLTDPGMFTIEQQESVTGIDIILITHEHRDHLHIESVKKILANNPQAVVVTNTAVGKMLEKDSIPYQLLEDGQNRAFEDLVIEGFGTKHAVIHSSIPVIQNTGYMIGGRLCYPGDAFEAPPVQPEIIALPVVGPWLKISEPVDYVLQLKPKFVFPVHDAFLKFAGPFYAMPKQLFESYGIKFIEPDESGEMEF